MSWCPQTISAGSFDAFVGSLDFGQLGFNRAEPAATGRPACDRAHLLKLYLYGYPQQVRSSRRLEREWQRNVELMRLLNRLAPDHKTIAEFRRREGAALRAVRPRRLVTRHLHEAALQPMHARATPGLMRLRPAVPAARSMGCRHRDEPGDAGVETETGDGGAWER